MADDLAELERFLRGERDAADFPHREHVRMAFEMLCRHSFVETVLHYSRALRTMVARAGKPDVYHETVTIAFLSLISERAYSTQYADFETFERTNVDLFDKMLLGNWYRPERLGTDLARRTFLLPEPTQYLGKPQPRSLLELPRSG